MKNLLFLLSILVGSQVWSQHFKGIVIDAKTNSPIEGVHVYSEELEKGTLTNSEGIFKFLDFSSINEIKIKLSHVAYHSKNVLIGAKEYQTIPLNKKVELLHEVEIPMNQKLNKRIAFKKLAHIKNGVHAFGVTHYNGKIYVIGGNSSYNIDDMKQTLLNYPDLHDFGQYLNKVKKSSWKKIFNGDLRVYDIEADKWYFHKDKFNDRAHHRISIWDDKLFIIGGLRLTPSNKREYLQNDIEILNLRKDSSNVDYTNPHQAVDFSLTRFKDHLILMGGSTKLKRNGFKEYSNKIHFFNLKTGHWYDMGVMPIAKECNSVLVGEKIFIVGGFNRKPLHNIESYDISTQKWKLEGEMFSGITKPALAVNDETIYIFDNGKILTLNVYTKELLEYAIELYLVNAEMLFVDDKLIIIGGLKVDGTAAIPSRGVYSIDPNEFEKTIIQRSKSI